MLSIKRVNLWQNNKFTWFGSHLFSFSVLTVPVLPQKRNRALETISMFLLTMINVAMIPHHITSDPYDNSIATTRQLFRKFSINYLLPIVMKLAGFHKHMEDINLNHFRHLNQVDTYQQYTTKMVRKILKWILEAYILIMIQYI